MFADVGKDRKPKLTLPLADLRTAANIGRLPPTLSREVLAKDDQRHHCRRANRDRPTPTARADPLSCPRHQRRRRPIRPPFQGVRADPDLLRREGEPRATTHPAPRRERLFL